MVKTSKKRDGGSKKGLGLKSRYFSVTTGKVEKFKNSGERDRHRMIDDFDDDFGDDFGESNDLDFLNLDGNDFEFDDVQEPDNGRYKKHKDQKKKKKKKQDALEIIESTEQLEEDSDCVSEENLLSEYDFGGHEDYDEDEIVEPETEDEDKMDDYTDNNSEEIKKNEDSNDNDYDLENDNFIINSYTDFDKYTVEEDSYEVNQSEEEQIDDNLYEDDVIEENQERIYDPGYQYIRENLRKGLRTEADYADDDSVVREYRHTKHIQSEQEFEAAHRKYNDRKHIKREFDILSDYPDNELPIIELYRTYKKYSGNGEVVALKDVNFRIEKGEFVFIVGKSGSGKSTLIKLLLRDIKPTSGRVYVNGRELTRLHRRKIAKFRRSIGVVFQDFKLLNDRNVYENVAFAQRVIGKSQKEIRRNVPHILSVVGLGDKQYSFPSELSGGEQQRVALARALINKPAILLADEPTGNLDPKTAWEIMDLLDEINKQGTTVIVVTHNVEIVDAMKKRVIAIDKGQIVSDEQRGGYSHED